MCNLIISHQCISCDVGLQSMTLTKSGWGSHTLPPMQYIVDVLFDTFCLMDLHNLVQCELVCKLWRDLLQRRAFPTLWFRDLQLTSKTDKSTRQRGLTLCTTDNSEISVSVVGNTDSEAFCTWLRGHLAGVAILHIILADWLATTENSNVQGEWLLPEVLSMLCTGQVPVIPQLALQSGSEIVLSAPYCCNLLASTLTQWTCIVENNQAEQWENLAKLTALTKLEFVDWDRTFEITTELQLLTNLHTLVVPQYNNLPFDSERLRNLEFLHIIGGPQPELDLASSTHLTSLLHQTHGQYTGQHHWWLPMGDTVQLRRLQIIGVLAAQAKDHFVLNLGLATQLTYIYMYNTSVFTGHPVHTEFWPTCLPNVAVIEMEDCPDTFPQHSFAQYNRLTQLCWSIKAPAHQMILPSVFGHLAQLHHLQIMGACFEHIPSQVMALTQLSYLDLQKNGTLLTITTDVFRMATWPRLEYLNLSADSAEYGMDAQTLLCQLRDMLDVRCTIFS